jgi:hypothetical protein
MYPDKTLRAELDQDARVSEWRKKAKAAARARKQRKLYVITLHPDVLQHRQFRYANPGYVQDMPCVYVGMTIHEPGDRFQQHKTGYRSSKYPRKYGIELSLELMEGFEGQGLNDEEKEASLANWLRGQGFGVWQN